MKFWSKWRNLRLVLRPVRKLMNEYGEFYLTDGHTIEFQNGVYETDNQKEIDFLSNHPYFGHVITTFDAEKELHPPKELLKRLREYMQRTEKEIVKGTSDKSKRWTCPFCEQIFTSGFKLGDHKKKMHLDELAELETIKKIADNKE